MDKYRLLEEKYRKTRTKSNIKTLLILLIFLLIALVLFIFLREVLSKNNEQNNHYSKNRNSHNSKDYYKKKDFYKKVNYNGQVLTTTSKVPDLYVLERNFKFYKNYDTAIKIGYLYYNSKNYSKAIYWAVQASKVKPKADASWILYAKSQYYLNNKALAIKALKLYLKSNYSKNASLLLKRIYYLEDK